MDLLLIHALNAEREIELQRAARRLAYRCPRTRHMGPTAGARLRRLVWAVWRVTRRRTAGLHRLTTRRTPMSDIDAWGEGGGTAMMICALCKFVTPLDDVVLAGPGARCVCLRCYSRETGTTRRMSGALEQRLRGVLEHV